MPLSGSGCKSNCCRDAAIKHIEIYLLHLFKPERLKLLLKSHIKSKLILASLTLIMTNHLLAQAIQDDLNHTIEITQPVNRIIALSPHLVELAYTAGAGDKLVARVDHADYPQQAKDIPSLGAFNNWSIEQVLALKPDLVLVWLTANGDRPVKQLKELGINVYVSEPRQLTDIAKTIRDIGKLAATDETANKNADAFETQINALANEYKHKKTISVFYQVWGQPLMTINDQQLISRIIEICGGQNIYADLAGLAPSVDPESLIIKNPQVMIGGATDEIKDNWLQQWLQWPEIAAVKNQQLYFINPDLLNRQTVRMIQGAKAMCTYIDNARGLP